MEVVIWSVAVLAAVALAGLVWFWKRRRRLTAIIASSAQERAQWNQLQPRAERVMVELGRLRDTVAGTTSEKLVAGAAGVEAALDMARPAVAALPQPIDQSSSPDDAMLRYRAADRLIGDATRRVGEAEQLVTTTNERIDALASAKQRLLSEVGTARSAAKAQGELGWRIDTLLADCAEIEQEAEAIKLMPPIDLERHETNATGLQQRIDALASEAAELPERHGELLRQASEYRDRTSALDTDRIWLQNQLEAWALLHHWQSFAEVSEHPPSVEGRLTEAGQLLAQTAADGGLLDMDVQDVRGAATAIDRVRELLDQGEQMIDQARALNVELARSAVEAEQLVPTAEQASINLAKYVAEHTHDLKDKFSEPAGVLQTQVEQAKSHLQLRPPDSLGAMNLATQMIADAQRLLDAGKAEVTRMNKLRSEARRSIGQARSALADLDRYTDGIFAGVFGGSRRSNVERLTNSLRSAERRNEPRVNEPQAARRDADAIAAEATKLLKKYKRADADD